MHWCSSLLINLSSMDPESLGSTISKAPRKVRFAPKGPPRRAQKPVVVKAEKKEDLDAAQAQELLRRFNEASVRGKPKVEKKVAHVQVAFGHGGSSSSRQSYGAPKVVPASGALGKEYKEPWDYYSNYPVTLPMRRPYSGNPELLDEEEFGDASNMATYDEFSLNPATELGLMEENLETSVLFFQLPEYLPTKKQSANPQGQETASDSKAPNVLGQREKACSLDDLPAGHMGKLLVYRSGSIKLKLGDTLYDVSPGLVCEFAQEVVAINTEEKHYCTVGEINKHAVITPDMDSILANLPDFD